MTITAPHPVDDFARAVRAALADLPADELEELTDGLEADLAERAADEKDPDFGDPVAYANELRSAAGLPPRSPKSISGMSSVLGRTWAELMRGLKELQTHPLVARLVAFFIAIRPLWWAFRAWVFYGIVAWALNIPALSFNLGTIVIGLACLILSVQLGRGKWQPRAWMRAALTAVNVVLVITVPVALLATSFAFSSEVNDAFADGLNQSADSGNGLTYNGQEITNIFAYDAAGKPLTDVQLYDQKGRPLDTVPDAGMRVTDAPFLVPSSKTFGHRGWNVYPLESIKAGQLDDNGEPVKGAKSKPVTPTFLIVAPLKGADAPTPSATPTPTASPTPTN
jgi:hypothetical protein